jgi:hypothetical protein
VKYPKRSAHPIATAKGVSWNYLVEEQLVGFDVYPEDAPFGCSRSNHGQTSLSPATDSGNQALTWQDWWAILGLNQ